MDPHVLKFDLIPDDMPYSVRKAEAFAGLLGSSLARIADSDRTSINSAAAEVPSENMPIDDAVG